MSNDGEDVLVEYSKLEYGDEKANQFAAIFKEAYLKGYEAACPISSGLTD